MARYRVRRHLFSPKLTRDLVAKLSQGTELWPSLEEEARVVLAARIGLVKTLADRHPVVISGIRGGLEPSGADYSGDESTNQQPEIRLSQPDRERP